MKDKRKSSGNIFFLLFASIALVGILAASIQSYIIGPLRTASAVNKKEAAQTQMQISARVATVNSATTQPAGGDCDGDGFVEPIPYQDASPAPQPVGGGLLPVSIAGSTRDPWNNRFGYCVWDHGPSVNAVGCGGGAQKRLTGTNATSWDSIVLISPGPNKGFETTCNAWADVNADSQPDVPLVQKAAGNDDIVFEWKYSDAYSASGGLWNLVPLDATTAEIGKNLSVKDAGNAEVLSFDSTAKTLTLGSSGRGDFPTLKLNTLQALTSPSIQLLNALAFFPEDTTGTTFTWKNATGDALTLSQGTYNMASFDTTNRSMKIGLSSNDFMRFYDYGAGEPILGISTNANSALSSGIQLTSTNNNGVAVRRHFIEGIHTPTNPAEADLTSVLFFVPGANGASATNLSGSMTFNTRNSGTAYGAVPTEKMYLSNAGAVSIGSATPAGKLHVTGNTILGDSGNVTVGSTLPITKLDVAGSIKVGNGAELCDVTKQGAIRYNNVSKCVEVCNSTIWSCMRADACSNDLADVSDFLNDINLAASTLKQTTTINQITGATGCDVEVSIAGTGTPQYRTCTDGSSDANCTASVVQNWTSAKSSAIAGQYIQLRNTSSATAGVQYIAVLKVGSFNLSWRIATQGSCAVAEPLIGTICADGTLYVGLSPHTGTKMYTTPCDYGMTWSGTACTGSATSSKWSNTAGIVTGVTNQATGRTNTLTLAALVNGNSPYTAATNCKNLSYGGKTDWYLPSTTEADTIVSSCNSFPLPNCSATGRRWTSTEASGANAMFYQFNKNTGNSSKTTAYNIYCVRKD